MIKLHVWASLPNRSMNNIYQRHLFIGAFKKLLKFWMDILEALLEKDPRSEVIVLSCSTRQAFLNILEKNTKKTTVLELLFKEVSNSKGTPSQAFSWEFCEILKKTYFTEHFRWSWSLSLKKLYILGFHERVFGF